MDSRNDAVLDTSVLLNFLAVDRVDLLVEHPSFRFIITDHVRGEITCHYSDQYERLETAISASVFGVSSVFSLDPTFVTLVKDGRLGAGECAAIALAANRGFTFVTDDKRATKAAQNVSPGLKIECTETLMISLIKASVLDVATGDAIKAEWETKFRFKLMFGSFAEKV